MRRPARPHRWEEPTPVTANRGQIAPFSACAAILWSVSWQNNTHHCSKHTRMLRLATIVVVQTRSSWQARLFRHLTRRRICYLLRRQCQLEAWYEGSLETSFVFVIWYQWCERLISFRAKERAYTTESQLYSTLRAAVESSQSHLKPGLWQSYPWRDLRAHCHCSPSILVLATLAVGTRRTVMKTRGDRNHVLHELQLDIDCRTLLIRVRSDAELAELCENRCFMASAEQEPM